MPVRSMKTAPDAGHRLDRLFVEGTSAQTKSVELAVQQFAQSDVPLLILGEPGGGKETLARRIHRASKLGHSEFRKVVCGTLEDQNRDFFEILSFEGTLYLSEIGELSSSAQADLVRALDRIEKADKRVSARLICGSAKNLENEVASGQFDAELYFRIGALGVRLAPLRYRKGDIPLLTDFFLAHFAREFARPMPALSEPTRQLFQDHTWPGNIRELEDATRAIVVLGDESLAMGGLRSIFSRSDREHNRSHIPLREATRAASREAEKELIMNALTRTRWNRRRAAQELKISYKALLYKLKQIGYSQSEAS